MKKNYHWFRAFFLWAVATLIVTFIQAQTLSPQAISSSGGFYSAGGNTLSFTIAEMTMVQSFIKPSGMLTQGFQQPELFTVAIEEYTSMGEFTMFPNPTSGPFTLEYTAIVPGDFTLSVYNMIGQVIHTQVFHTEAGTNQLAVDLSNQRQGIYFLEMSSNESSKKSSIIKKINLIY